MKLQFNPESKVTEWANGPLRFFNEGKPIEVETRTGQAMLKQVHEVAPQQFVNVFIVADQGKPKKSEQAELAATYPNDFPFVELLTKAGFGFDEVKALDHDSLLKIDGIGPKSAEAILETLKEK